MEDIETETMESLLNWKKSKTHSDDFSQWLKDTQQKPLTGTRVAFAHWCFKNKDVLLQVGDLDSTFVSIRKWLKQVPNK